MAVKLWTIHFMRVCVANLLLFISLYVLFPVLPIEMAEHLGVSVAKTGLIFLFFTLGMFFIGPFHAYIVDAYKRKHVCMFSFALIIASAVGYNFVTNLTELILLSAVQGVAFGIATTAGITLAIDVTNTALRSAGNINFSWLARLGMIIGIALGVWLYQYYSFNNLLTVSVICGAVGILLIAGVYVPFRAPIVTKLYSCDRFLLLRGWPLALNLILVSFVSGLLIPLVHPFLNDFMLADWGAYIPFFAGVGIGYLLSLLFVRIFVLGENALRAVVLGILLQLISISLLSGGYPVVLSSILLGLGLGLIMPEFLVMFVKLSHHCQRGTANTTHLLAAEIGLSLGVAVACHFDLQTDRMLLIAQLASSLALLLFIFVSYPYYKKKKAR